VRWGKTPRQAAATAVKQLQDAGARVAGTALTRLDLSKQTYYGYGDYGYYTTKMKGYYTQ
jgi:Mrp family chromosome partitioning ATPase